MNIGPEIEEVEVVPDVEPVPSDVPESVPVERPERERQPA
jgi:hypothetical protein